MASSEHEVTGQGHARPGSTVRRAKLIVLATLGALIVVLLLFNGDPTPLNVFGRKATLPLSVWLLASFAVGVLVGIVGPRLMRRKQR